MKLLGNLLPAMSRGQMSNASNASNASAPRGNLCSELQAARAAVALFGQFRRSDTDDPEVFHAAAKRIFMGFPEDIVLAVVDPLTGIARIQAAQNKIFLPLPAELLAEL